VKLAGLTAVAKIQRHVRTSPVFWRILSGPKKVDISLWKSPGAWCSHGVSLPLLFSSARNPNACPF